MTSVYRSNRKATDDDLLRLNNLGLSLGTIAQMLSCHPTTVTQRLKALGVPVADTRRSFMEDIYHTMTPAQREWLCDELGQTTTVKEYVKKLIVEAFLKSR
ncbi:hypothetical protein [Rhizobium phage RHph_X2_28B]|uniref:hypothetical protein n=1 Tax=Rhizobium phage RHph_X2_28B TaxID=2836086 RepID=UPI002329343F|nr:hypothetical protein PP751_gp053 [Rhizobium phage RHph_X2_28B]QWY83505.1 hypothetical protein [Rhizobium phage RHph_X2_28B]QWY83741.1 hypothetical protein [Rhizobium phage RHph_X3_15]